MTEIKFTPDITVELIRRLAADEFVTQAARVSTGKDLHNAGTHGPLIRRLMLDRHGSPFEHGGMFTFRVHAPIFVFREWQRHRVGWSYNEQSGRYTQFEPVFYVPPVTRQLVQTGKPMDYTFEDGDEYQRMLTGLGIRRACEDAWERYEELINGGIAREIARSVLPVNTFSSMYATANPRAIMHFLSLRTEAAHALHPSHPQWEIRQAANQVEHHFSDAMPVTWTAWHECGRVAP